MKPLKLKEFEFLNFAIEVDHKPKRKVMISSEISDKRRYNNDMQFEIRLPNGVVERKYITRRRLEEISNIIFRVIREKLYE